MFNNFPFANHTYYGVNRYSGGGESDVETRWDRGGCGAAGDCVGIWEINPTWQYVDNINLWLKPGWGLGVYHMTAGQAIEVHWAWYEFLSVEA